MPGANAQHGVADHPPEHLLVAALTFAGAPSPQAAMAALHSCKGWSSGSWQPTSTRSRATPTVAQPSPSLASWA